jgi:hypothetical protein
MKRALTLFLACTLAGCSSGSVRDLPTGPDPISPVPTPISQQLTSVWVVVIDDPGGGGCVRDAVVEVVAGQGIGRRLTQVNNCSYWDPDYSAFFRDITPNVPMTLRASAPGYNALELTVTPYLGGQRAVTFSLSRAS